MSQVCLILISGEKEERKTGSPSSSDRAEVCDFCEGGGNGSKRENSQGKEIRPRNL